MHFPNMAAYTNGDRIRKLSCSLPMDDLSGNFIRIKYKWEVARDADSHRDAQGGSVRVRGGLTQE